MVGNQTEIRLEEWKVFLHDGIPSFVVNQMPSLAEQINKPNVLIIDVRSTAECACGDGYRGCKNIPINELAQRISECGTDKSRPIITYCGAGMRAATAAKVLKEHGFEDVVSAANAGTLRAAKSDK